MSRQSYWTTSTRERSNRFEVEKRLSRAASRRLRGSTQNRSGLSQQKWQAQSTARNTPSTQNIHVHMNVSLIGQDAYISLNSRMESDVKEKDRDVSRLHEDLLEREAQVERLKVEGRECWFSSFVSFLKEQTASQPVLVCVCLPIHRKLFTISARN